MEPGHLDLNGSRRHLANGFTTPRIGANQFLRRTVNAQTNPCDWEMGGWESIEMVRRYAHLAPNHLTEHARKIDDIFGDNVPNMSHSEIMEDIKKA